MRVMYVVHRSHGRLRLRMGCLRDEREAANGLADSLAALPGMEEVRIRPFTGSVLALHDPVELPASRIEEVVRERMRVTHVVQPGEEGPAEVERELVRIALLNGSRVAKTATRAIEELDLEVLRASRGSVNLGTLMALGFLGLGAAEVVSTGKLPMPPWFNLGWWAFRTFTITEKKVIAETRESFDQEITALEGQAST